MSDHFAIEKDGAATVVIFNGPTLMNLPELERIGRQLEALVDDGVRTVVLDFAKVEFLSSQGIGIVLALNKKLKTAGGKGLAICGLTPRLLELFKITRLEKILKLMPSRADAVKVLG